MFEDLPLKTILKFLRKTYLINYLKINFISFFRKFYSEFKKNYNFTKKEKNKLHYLKKLKKSN